MIEKNLPERPAKDQREAAEQNGGFAPRARKTRIAGVISADGKGSLNVANTAIGRYQGSTHACGGTRRKHAVACAMPYWPGL